MGQTSGLCQIPKHPVTSKARGRNDVRRQRKPSRACQLEGRKEGKVRKGSKDVLDDVTGSQEAGSIRREPMGLTARVCW